LFFEGKEGEGQEKKSKNKHNCSGLGHVTSCCRRGRHLELTGKCRVKLFKTSGSELKTSCVISHREALLLEKKGK